MSLRVYLVEIQARMIAEQKKKKKKMDAQEEKMVAQRKMPQRLPVAGHEVRAADAPGCAWNGAR